MITRRRWEAGIDPVEMLDLAYTRVTKLGRHPERGRKISLYLTALGRQFWGELPWILRITTELTERIADGEFDESQLRQPLSYITEGVELGCGSALSEPVSRQHLWRGISDYEKYLTEIGFAKPPDADRAIESIDLHRLYDLARLAEAPHLGPSPHQYVPVTLHSVSLIRDIFGNPFRPVAFDPAWRTDTAVSLARGMYDARDFAPMPILADALQDAGCDSADILDHCRNPEGTHVRGCWVVDLVLGKE